MRYISFIRRILAGITFSGSLNSRTQLHPPWAFRLLDDGDVGSHHHFYRATGKGGNNRLFDRNRQVGRTSILSSWLNLFWCIASSCERSSGSVATQSQILRALVASLREKKDGQMRQSQEVDYCCRPALMNRPLARETTLSRCV